MTLPSPCKPYPDCQQGTALQISSSCCGRPKMLATRESFFTSPQEKKPMADSHEAELAHLPPVNNLTSRLSTLLLAPHALLARLPQRCGDFLAGICIIHPGHHPAAGLCEKNAGHPVFNHEFTFTGERPHRELNKSPSISKCAEEMIANVLKHLTAKVFQQD